MCRHAPVTSQEWSDWQRHALSEPRQLLGNLCTALAACVHNKPPEEDMLLGMLFSSVTGGCMSSKSGSFRQTQVRFKQFQ